MNCRQQSVLLCIVWVMLVLVPLSLRAEHIEAEAGHVPWSGYWWPLSSAKHVFGFNGHPAPLEKYDLYTAHTYPGMATSWEESNMYDPDGELWYGYCHAWANAAVLEDEPVQGAVLDNVYFSVGDKKALLTLVHADDSQDWASCNADPLNFHLYLLRYLVEQGLPFIADLDASSEVWSYPVFRVEMDITSGSSADQVQASIYYADDLDVPPDFVGTRNATKTYTYTLNKDSDGSYISGEWTGSSKDDHPDTIWYPLAQKALNPYLDYSLVREIARSEDQGLQSLDQGLPGHYLVLLEANGTASLQRDFLQGEELTFSLAVDSQSPATSGLTASLSAQGSVQEASMDTDLYSFSLQGTENGTALLSLQGAANASQVVHLYVKSSFKDAVHLVSLPSNYYWGGLAVQNRSLTRKAHIRCYYPGREDLPLLPAVFSGAELEPGGQLVSLLDYNCTPDYSRAGAVQALVLSSDQPLAMVKLTGNGDEMYAETPWNAASPELVIPELSNWYDFDKNISLQLFLPGTGQNSTLDISYFQDGGTAWSSKEFTIEPSTLQTYYQGGYPGSASLSGWALLSACPDGLQGYALAQGSGPEGTSNAELIPFLAPQRVFYLPHVATTSPWQTRLVLINPGGQAEDVEISALSEFSQDNSHLVLEAHQRQELELTSAQFDLTDQELDRTWLRIEASGPVAGYFVYSYNQDQSLAALPLLGQSRLSPLQYLPLCASNDLWWTGLAVCNPNQSALDINVRGLDQSGQELAAVSVQLAAQDKKVVALRSLFPENYADLHSLVLEGSADFAGLVLLGTRDGNQQLSGYVLQ